MNEFTVWDLGFAFVVLFSTWWGFSRGAIIDLVATLIFVVAVVGGFLFASTVGSLILQPTPTGPSPWAAPLGFVIVFIAATIVGTLIRRMIDSSVEDSGMRPADRTIGLVLGFVRGVLIVLVIIAGTLKWTGDAPVLVNSWSYGVLSPFHEDVRAFVDLLIGSPISV